MNRKIIQLVVLSLSLAACVTNYAWVKHGNPASQRDFDLDDMQCTQEAMTAYPQSLASYTTGTPKTISCSQFGGNVNCNEFGGETARIYDANAGGRDRFWKTCMSSKGWSRQRASSVSARQVSDLPTEETEKFVVEVDGYCNETDDCVRGLSCSNHKCVKDSDIQRPSAATAKRRLGGTEGRQNKNDNSCRDNQIRIDNRCVIDFGKAR